MIKLKDFFTRWTKKKKKEKQKKRKEHYEEKQFMNIKWNCKCKIFF